MKDYTYIDIDGIEKELCVICGAETGVKTSENIDNRTGYIEGSGQMCYSCTCTNSK